MRNRRSRILAFSCLHHGGAIVLERKEALLGSCQRRDHRSPGIAPRTEGQRNLLMKKLVRFALFQFIFMTVYAMAQSHPQAFETGIVKGPFTEAELKQFAALEVI